MIQELAKLVFDVAVAMIQSAIAFAHRHRFGLLTVLVLFLCLQAIYRDYAELTDNEITIYTGLPGSSCHEIAGKLRDSLRLRSTAFGGKYKVRVIETHGTDEIQERLRGDTTGRAVGFAQDERGNAPEVQTVAPLELDYLHVIAGRSFLENAQKYNALLNKKARQKNELQRAPRPENLTNAPTLHIRDFLDYLNSGSFAESGKVFLGPLRSETRRLSEIVLQQCGIRNPARLSTHGINDWYEIRAALNTDHVSLAFFIGPLGSPVIAGIADDGHCRLVNLDEIGPAVQAEHSEFKVREVPGQSYVAAAYRPEALKFCGVPVSTLTTRNVIACSGKLPDFDAWQVGRRQ